ncbi:MAG TPA: ATP-binding protein [Vicinamibacterales bacterium]|nr:ATP-binding protein [Vicinamibacterales bacterium]
MRLSIRTRQVLGVTAIVAASVLALTAWYLLSLANLLLVETQARAEQVANTIYQRAVAIVASGEEPTTGLALDGGLRSILEGSLYARDIAYAAIVDVDGAVLAHVDGSLVGTALAPADALERVMAGTLLSRVRTLYVPGGQMLEVRQDLLLDGRPFGSIRVGFSTLLIRSRFEESLRVPVITALSVLLVAVLVSMVLARIVVRPIHVIGSGLARLGRGELDALPEMPTDEDLGDIGASFRAVATRLAADRTELAGRKATLESVAQRLEDAVALFASDGTLLFANPAMRPFVGDDGQSIGERLPADHPYRLAVERALAGDSATGTPVTVTLPDDGGERQIVTQGVSDADNAPIGVMLVAQDRAYLGEVQSTIQYSHKLAALSRLSAGIAHEIKNPLNAVMIHLELLKLRLAGQPEAAEHVAVIASQMRRLDEVVHGFLKFTRPEELKPRPVSLAGVLAGLMPVLEAEASKSGVTIRLDCPSSLPDISGDRHMLEQAFLNLGLNACQAMPTGGRLDIVLREDGARRVEVRFEDTGTGIPPDALPRIFDLYFTTREAGSGIGLSLVFRTVQLHDGEIEVHSTPGRGTTFRLLLPRAQAAVLPIAAS